MVTLNSVQIPLQSHIHIFGSRIFLASVAGTPTILGFPQVSQITQGEILVLWDFGLDTVVPGTS